MSELGQGQEQGAQSTIALPPNFFKLSPAQRMATLLQEQARRMKNDALSRYVPYPKQREFHAAGVNYSERLLMAGNQLGKTMSAAAECAMHLTGRYPDWWEGRVWHKGINMWAAGVTSEGVRDGAQRMLFGRIGALGTGMIPADAILGEPKKKSHGAADAIDYAIIRHGGGGDIQQSESQIAFKSYDQGREKFQAESLEVVWLDEEPSGEDIYFESLTRTNARKGIVFLTFTPLKGMSAVVKRFVIERPASTHVTQMTIEDALHYTPEERAAIIARYPEHERAARAMGIPSLGDGAVFPVTEDSLLCDPFPIPNHWYQIAGIDFGFDHPTGAAKIAWDKDTDCIYLTACARERHATPVMFAAQVRGWGKWIPWSWPHDGLQHDKGSGLQLAAQYRDNGLPLLATNATHEAGGIGVEAGLIEMLERMQTGRFKVFKTCTEWREEFRMYYRKGGKVVKTDDDVICASRYAIMMRRFAVAKPRALGGPVVAERFIGDSYVGY